MPNNGSEKVIIHSVIAGLDEILGERLRKSLLARIESDYSLKVEDIPRNAEKLIETLGKILGNGSLTIENIIAKHLAANAGIEKIKFSEMVSELLNR